MNADPELRYPFNALISFHYYKSADVAALAAAGLRIIGDSGAYSARSLGIEISIPEFAEWCHHWRSSLVWVASLDRINEPKYTWANYRKLRGKYGLDVVPTLHAGDDKRWLDRYAAEGVDFLGLGGLVPHNGRPGATLPWLTDLMRYARDRHPTMRFHGWGVTNQTLTKALPWYSVDSSNLGQPYRYARINLFDRAAGRWVTGKLDGKDVFKLDDLLRRDYGVRARDIARSTKENRRLLVRVSGRSYQLVEDYLRRRHGPVSGPTYGVREPAATRGGRTAGTHVHATDGALAHLRHLGKP